MPPVGQFCASNVARLLLTVVIIVTLVAAICFWLYQSPGHGNSIEQPAQSAAPDK
jgi:F0F1-type ATP synthase assembly protein I